MAYYELRASAPCFFLYCTARIYLQNTLPSPQFNASAHVSSVKPYFRKNKYQLGQGTRAALNARSNVVPVPPQDSTYPLNSRETSLLQANADVGITCHRIDFRLTHGLHVCSRLFNCRLFY